MHYSKKIITTYVTGLLITAIFVVACQVSPHPEYGDVPQTDKTTDPINNPDCTTPDCEPDSNQPDDTSQPDNCPTSCTAGEKRCAENSPQPQVEICGDFQKNGCLTWGLSLECPPTEFCKEGACHEPLCLDTCPYLGARDCAVSGGYRVCSDHNNDGCVSWGYSTQCGTGTACETGECVAQCTGQNDVLFDKTFTHDQDWSLAHFSTLTVTPAGDFVAVGQTHDSLHTVQVRGWVTKINSVGSTIWSRIYGTDEHQAFSTITQNSAGFAIGGHHIDDPDNHSDPWVLMIAADGTLAHSFELPMPAASGISSIASVGNDLFISGSGGNVDSFFIKSTEIGQEVWRYTNSNCNHFHRFAMHNAGSILACTNVMAGGSHTEMNESTLLWIDEAGQEQKSYQLNHAQGVSAVDVIAHADGSLTVGGFVQDLNAENQKVHTFVLIHLNNDGTELWRANLGSSTYTTHGVFISHWPNGDIVATGNLAHEDGSRETVLARYSQEGEQRFLTATHSENYLVVHDVHALADGGAMLVGWRKDADAANFSGWLKRVDAKGESCENTALPLE